MDNSNIAANDEHIDSFDSNGDHPLDRGDVITESYIWAGYIGWRVPEYVQGWGRVFELNEDDESICIYHEGNHEGIEVALPADVYGAIKAIIEPLVRAELAAKEEGEHVR